MLLNPAIELAPLSALVSWISLVPVAVLVPAVALLGLGLLAGVQHALDADHLAAVATIVSERKHWLSSSLVGGLWGVGHTLALLLAGVAVLFLRVKISPQVETGLEFCVGLMLVGLGGRALWKLARGGRLHWHEHQHGPRTHAHPHVHANDGEHAHSSHAPSATPREHTHHGFKLGPRPLFIGMMHGLAGSAALMLLGPLVTSSPAVGLTYIALFGVGSIGGMMVMSSLLGLPFHLTATRFSRANLVARAAAGLFSVGFGLFMIYEKGFAEGLLR
jgi:ABC-type nickel/cobalt efflux system permease component RcnA